MTELQNLPPVRTPRPRGAVDADQVLRYLEDFCATGQPGDRVPTHTELMRRINASERTVLWALGELQRQGKIVRRKGAPTYIAGKEPQPQEVIAPLPSGPGMTGTVKNSVIAIAEPDGGIFDHAMQMLLKQGKAAKLALTCQMMHRHEADHFIVPPVEQGPRGYIVFRRHFLPLAERLQAAGHRVVFVGTPYVDKPMEVPCVIGDQEQGGYLAVWHMLQLGHRRIAFHFLDDYLTVKRWAGCRRALEEAREDGLEVHTEILEAAYGGEFDGQVRAWGRNLDTVRDYFAPPNAPTAIVSWNDDMAIKILTQLQRAGLRVPEDVSLIGYDNLMRSASVHPSLTTVDGVLGQQIQAALRLLSRPDPPPRTQSIIVLPALIQRESTAAPVSLVEANPKEESHASQKISRKNQS